MKYRLLISLLIALILMLVPLSVAAVTQPERIALMSEAIQGVVSLVTSGISGVVEILRIALTD